MLTRTEKCNIFDLNKQENKVVEFIDRKDLKSEIPDREHFIISTGPLTGIPLMGANVWQLQGYDSFEEEIFRTYGTGALGAMLKYAGFDHIVLYGAAPVLSYILVDDNGCCLKEYNDFSFLKKFQNYLEGEIDGPFSVLMNTEKGLTSEGLMSNHFDLAPVFTRHNIGAVVICGKGRVQITEPDKVLKKGIEVNERWMASKLKGGCSSCFVCHGRCNGLENREVIAEEQVALFVSLGICPQIISNGAIVSSNDIVQILNHTIGQDFSLEELWDYSKKLKIEEEICAGIGGSN